jgi:hypothetical protein
MKSELCHKDVSAGYLQIRRYFPFSRIPGTQLENRQDVYLLFPQEPFPVCPFLRPLEIGQYGFNDFL